MSDHYVTRRVLLSSLTVAVMAALASPGTSRSTYRNLIPNGYAGLYPGSGIKCIFLGHVPCRPGVARNQFGIDFLKNNILWDKTLCMKDSDGDGLTNGEELGDPCCEWSFLTPNRTKLRTRQLSHPGDRRETGARKAPKCMKGSSGKVAGKKGSGKKGSGKKGSGKKKGSSRRKGAARFLLTFRNSPHAA